MCWQPISLKNPTSQELLEAVERERSFRLKPTRNSTIFHHPTLWDFELQHLPAGVNDAELEERIIQHLAAAAAMGRVRHIARREGSRIRSSAHGPQQFLLFSTHPNVPSSGSVSTLAPGEEESDPAAITVATPSIPLTAVASEPLQHMPPFPSVQSIQNPVLSSGSTVVLTNRQGISVDTRTSAGQSSNQDRAGPSDFLSISDTWKSRLNAMSIKYKESISKSTRGWKERLFSRNTSMADIGSEVRREVDAGMASVSRMIERLETRETTRARHVSTSDSLADSSVRQQRNLDNVETLASFPQHFIFEEREFLASNYDMLRRKGLEGESET
ncbi:unnamed protein product [Ilex paraguariensis]|uniref:E3 ubiquitin-protein ligase RHF2A n=1 Tax=Ilex paraguariensis TaxID=185542 RepID=A0ABC8S6Z4_9AQUA